MQHAKPLSTAGQLRVILRVSQYVNGVSSDIIMSAIRLSVLDQSIVARGGSPAQAVHKTAQMVRLADELGYTRFWISEHHNMRNVAGSAPEVLLAYLGSQSKRIRIGSGGIMLPNHSALKMAENFRMLEALFPGRIDMGIGRAPGGDRLAAYLLNPGNQYSEKDFIEQLSQLEGYFSGSRTPGTIHEKVIASPDVETMPEQWLLTSSGGSGRIAARLGIAFSFAHFINPVGGPQAAEDYRQQFRPSAALQAPRVNFSIFAFCSEDPEAVERWTTEFGYRMLRIEAGSDAELPPFEEIKAYRYSAEQLARIAHNRSRMVAGAPQQVRAQLTALANDYGTDEIIISTFADDFEETMESFRLLARAFDIGGQA